MNRVLLLAIAAVLGASSAALAGGLALRGTLVTPDTIVENGTIVIDNDKITDLGPAATAPAGVAVVDVPGYVLPGFIDLHNHLPWNVFPRWHAGRTFGNR